MKWWTNVWLLAAIATLSGCSALPSDGPAHQDIAADAAAAGINPRNTIGYSYALVEINPIVVDCLAVIEAASFYKTFGGSVSALRVGVGDVLEVNVFESSAGGLFIAAGGDRNRPGNFITIPRQTVSSTGNISVPYTGVIQVAGRTLPEIEREIEIKLEKRALEPQVVLTMVEQNASTVNVVGDAITGASKVRLVGSSERVLDMISKAGGLRFPAYDSVVTLQRKNQSATIPFPTLVNDPKENVFVQPGDMIYVSREQRKFVALGAVGANVAAGVGLVGQFTFDQERLSLNEALAKAGGLQDGRADPAQVFLYRFERRETVERMGVDLSSFAPNQKVIPTIYKANFRDPSSFFLAQRFPMRNRDIIYVANADAIEVTKFLAYATTITGSTSAVVSDAAAVRANGTYLFTGKAR